MTVWYDARDLPYDGKDVIILSPEGDVVARRKVIARKERTITVWRIKVAERLPGRPIRYHYIDLPPHVQVTRWRPERPWEWPGQLPEPAKLEGPVAWQSPPPPVVPQEGSDPLDWPAEYSLPPHIGEREAEVRVLRALRTERSRHAVKTGNIQGYVDSVFATAMRMLGKWEGDYKDASYIAPAGEAWAPTRKDHGDWDTALTWWAQLSRAPREIVMLRSLNPPFSFQLIGERNNRSHHWARTRYRAAVKDVARIANGR